MEKNKLSHSQILHYRLKEIANNFDANGNCLGDIEIKTEFKTCFEKLYYQSIEDNYYWQYCPFTVYEKTLDLRLEQFLKQNLDSNEGDFLLNEIKLLGENFQKKENIICDGEDFIVESGYLFNGNDTIILLSKIIDEVIRKNIYYSQIRKLEFLKNYYDFEENNLSEFTEPEIFLDYSNNSQAERIVFLHELGILEYLQNKMNKELHGFSANKLAEIISTFTNIEQKTAQSYLNPMITKDNNQKNNPLSKNNLEKVKNKLKDIGFYTSKTA